jgi:protein-S-isoprenylcysteine O-methyltransferase Ste14
LLAIFVFAYRCTHSFSSKIAAPMRRSSAIFGSFIFLLIAPGVVAGLIPWWITRWRFEPPFFQVGTRALGALLIAAGTPAVLDSFARFALQGLGTPSPIAPTRHLVVTGLYGYVRNPMYVGVAAVVFGQALLFGSIRLLEYGLIITIAFHLFVILYEEPKLLCTFGDEYREFREHVPRWIPRLHPWRRS